MSYSFEPKNIYATSLLWTKKFLIPFFVISTILPVLLVAGFEDPLLCLIPAPDCFSTFLCPRESHIMMAPNTPFYVILIIWYKNLNQITKFLEEKGP